MLLTNLHAAKSFIFQLKSACHSAFLIIFSLPSHNQATKSPMLEILEDRSLFVISGPDRLSFMQGLITKNCIGLADHQLIYALMLSPHGKYLYDFFLVNDSDKLYIDIATPLSEEFFNKIQLYKLRSNISISREDSLIVVSSDSNQIALQAEIIHLQPDPRSSLLGFRIFSTKTNIYSDDKFYHEKRIANIIPEGFYDMIQNASFPLEYGFDQINAIDFDKGCYVGQELIARTHFRGEIRKKIFLLESNGNFAPKGTIIFHENKKIGVIGSSYHSKGLALLRVEDVQDCEINHLIIDNIEYKIHKDRL